MKRKIFSLLFVTGLLTMNSCKDALDYTPKGVLSSSDLTSPTAVEGLVTAAYAAIGNGDMIGPIYSNWVYGSVRSDDAYKGGGGTGDVGEIDAIEHYNLVTPSINAFVTRTWQNLFKSISRCNVALRAVNSLSEASYPNKKTRLAELRFLRAHSYFTMKLLYKNIPIFDENASAEEILKVSNNLSNEESWNKIAADFQFAIDNLPSSQPELGRANKVAAQAYLAKLRLYQAYEQNENHQVVNINKTRLQEVVTLTQAVISSGKYSLNKDIADNFLAETENGSESIFAIQFTINDGTTSGRLNFEDGLNYPHGAPQYGCCGFHAPSQNLVNAHATDENGLPKFDTFNDSNIDLTTATVDPRLDHTVGIDGHPYKYDNTKPFSNSWVRDAGVYGNFHSMRAQQLASSSSYFKLGPFMGTAKNYDILRYDDILLMQAEAYIELGQQASALPLINIVRKRAAESTGRLKKADGTFASKYLVKEYTTTGWTQAYARKALQWERRMEFATEGPRFFDLVRWGIAEPTLNAYINKEKTRRTFLNTAKFTAGRDEYLPIPQAEITFTNGLYKQNPGY
ncbi:RagB/SusD family nutrient uptake outer membrane protein [Flectobacillus sp. BAB-3569]|uniref:RagB/SusD family nutrient uptake outer membrane protein n=1 Tax=Flectobacillus sp. BAB-3569 TaxID=1509483 RepID=UPI000BA3E258|nr:RagB/SusD family nutrient uptake outer membrane protein [Flectobacillus sp. BAB-3569]PAC27214.1 RagB/SusD family nutrient uptake outer membrane protein [Flectobacillus sp. BAB-3569]